jgi:hypothetical protein
MKDYWLSDEKGLRLLIKPNGAKYWRMKYQLCWQTENLGIRRLSWSKPERSTY